MFDRARRGFVPGFRRPDEPDRDVGRFEFPAGLLAAVQESVEYSSEEIARGCSGGSESAVAGRVAAG